MVANVAAMRNWPTHQNTSAISALGMNTTTTLGQTIGDPSFFSLDILTWEWDVDIYLIL